MCVYIYIYLFLALSLSPGRLLAVQKRAFRLIEELTGKYDSIFSNDDADDDDETAMAF